MMYEQLMTIFECIIDVDRQCRLPVITDSYSYAFAGVTRHTLKGRGPSYPCCPCALYWDMYVCNICRYLTPTAACDPHLHSAFYTLERWNAGTQNGPGYDLRMHMQGMKMRLCII